MAGRPVSLPEPGTTIGIDEHGLPIHGAQPRLLRWRNSGNEALAQATLEWRTPELLEIFPFAHSVDFRATLEPGPALTIEVTVDADAGDPVPVAYGLHPYLRLPATPREHCRLELPACEGWPRMSWASPRGRRAARTGDDGA